MFAFVAFLTSPRNHFMEKSLSLCTVFLHATIFMTGKYKGVHLAMRAHPLNYNSIHAEKKAFPLPPLPSEEWCDFRKDYESGMTMKAIADKYICDPRTVKKCLLQNKSSKELGRQTAPTKLAPYMSTIDRLFQEYALTTSNLSQNASKPFKIPVMFVGC